MSKIQKNVFYIMREEEDKSFAGELFDWIMLFFIFVNLLFLFLDTFPTPDWYDLLSRQVELVTSIVFTIEYLLRLWIAPLYFPNLKPGKARLRYAFSILAIIDILAVIPFYLPLLFPIDFRVFRLFRFIRIVRLVKISRYTESVSIFISVFRKKSTQLLTSVVVIFILIIISSMLMYDLEHEAQPEVFQNAFSGLWWAMEAVTTAGNGEIYPITTAGKALAGVIALLGIGVIAVPTGIISAGFVSVMQENTDEIGTPLNIPEEIAKYKKLLDDNAISQEEYDAKKKVLLAIDEFPV